jgi:hypothetical protein
MRKILIAAIVASLVFVGAARFPAAAATSLRTVQTHSQVHRNVVYYAEGTIRLVAEHNYCLTYPINPAEGDRTFWYPCTTYKGKPVDIQMWYTEKVLGVGSISMLGFPWVMGKSHTNSDLYARVWKLSERPKQHFYTSFNIEWHNHIGWQAWMKVGPKIYVLSGPKNMSAKQAKVKPYYATLTNGNDLRKRFWAIDFVPGFKVMDQASSK